MALSESVVIAPGIFHESLRLVYMSSLPLPVTVTVTAPGQQEGRGREGRMENKREGEGERGRIVNASVGLSRS